MLNTYIICDCYIKLFNKHKSSGMEQGKVDKKIT